MRKLKYHEQKLLKKVNFLDWKSTNTAREQKITGKFHLERDDYHKYNIIVGKIRRLTAALSKLKDTDALKNTIGRNLVAKLYQLNLIENKKLLEARNISVSSFCKRRITYVMIKNKMVPHTQVAVTMVEQNMVRFGNKIIEDKGFIIPRGMDEFVGWVDNAKMKKAILEFNEENDDYEEY